MGLMPPSFFDDRDEPSTKEERLQREGKAAGHRSVGQEGERFKQGWLDGGPSVLHYGAQVLDPQASGTGG